MENNEEIWRPVVGFEKYYKVSNLGNVISNDRIIFRIDGKCCFRKSKIMKQYLSTTGYFMVDFKVDKTIAKRAVHRLVVESFLGEIPNDMCVNHIDAIKTNNNILNLEIVTPSENIKHAFKLGYKGSNYGRFGYKCTSSKPVYQINPDTMEIISDFGSAREACRVTGISYKSISLCITGKSKTAGGFVWNLQNNKNERQ